VAALPAVLLIDDDVAVCKAIEFRLRGSADVTAIHSADAAIEAVREKRFDAAIVDVNLGAGISGTTLVSVLRNLDPDLASIIFTAHANYQTALESIGAHSFDFIPKKLSDDRVLSLKVASAVERTREQRDRSRGVAEAARLKAELAEAVVSSELEVTSGDIQRGLLRESLSSFSSLLGQIELLDVYIANISRGDLEMAKVSRLSAEAMGDLQDYVGRLRDYFAQPQRAVTSINDVVLRAVRVVEADYDEGGSGVLIEKGQLQPDRNYSGDGRALLRAIVVLLRLMAKSGTGRRVVSLKPSLVLNPMTDIKMAGVRGNSRVLRTAKSQKNTGVAVAIEISGPRGGVTADRIATLFSTDGPAVSDASPWSALSMVERIGGSLVVEVKGGVNIWFFTECCG